MPSTEDRQYVLASSERLPGEQTCMASVIESDFDDIESLIEKSGTGIYADEEIGCRLLQEMLADSRQCKFGLVWEKVHSSKPHQDYQPGLRKPTRH